MNRSLISAAALAILLLSSCGKPAEPKAQVRGAWVRLPAAPGGAGAGYFESRANRSDEALLSVSAPGARIEMHESMTENHMSSMRPLATAPFEDRKLEFAPGGKHLMIFGLDPALKRRGSIPLTLHFKGAPPVTVPARLIGAGDPPPSDGD
jgi:copper(I)-binding protein